MSSDADARPLAEQLSLRLVLSRTLGRELPAVGRYVVRKKLGQGGEAFVFLAHDPTLDRELAIKVLHGKLGREQADSLLTEARMLAQLDHPNILPVYDAGAEGDDLWLATAVAHRGSLHAHMQRHPPTDWRPIARYFVQAARGLEAAHLAGVVHRDIKPSNFLVSADGRLLIADFGLASSSQSVSGDELVGTPGYWSPELESGEAAHPGSDQYALCASFSRLFRELPPQVEIPDALSELLERGLQVDPAGRWESLTQLRERLESLTFPQLQTPGESATWPLGVSALDRGLPRVERKQMRVEDLVELASDTSSLAEFRVEALRWLNRYVGFDTVLLGNVELEGELGPHIEGFSAEFVEQFRARAERYAPTLARIIGESLVSGRTIRDTDLYSSTIRGRTPFYNEIIGPKGSRFMAVGALRVGSALVGSLQISRASNHMPYSDRELARIDRSLRLIAMGERLRAPPAAGSILPEPTPQRSGAMERAVTELSRLGLSPAEVAETCGLQLSEVQRVLSGT